MTNQNNVPTGPGWYYRHDDYDQNQIVYCFHWEVEGGLLYYKKINGSHTRVTDDGLWAGPVPKPGGWAPRELFDRILNDLLSLGFPSRAAGDAIEWQEANS